MTRMTILGSRNDLPRGRRPNKEGKEQRTRAEREDVERRRQQEDAEAAIVDNEGMRARYGDLEHPVEISLLDEVVRMPAGKQVTFRARLHTQRSESTKFDIIVLRHRGFIIQGVLSTYCEHIFKIRSTILRVFRDTLDDLDHLEINTPKLQPAATESGAEVFRVNYFGRKAFLAQSPQLMKQMAISADFGRVYEIGPVFRAENSNTHRHLTEYTGLDIEMSIQQDYHEVFHVLDMVMKVDMVMKNIKAISSMRPELERVRETWPSEDFEWLEQTPVIPFPEAIQMLRDDGPDVEEEDLSTPDEIRLGELVHQKYGADFYIVDRLPISARPFYTANDGKKSTNSFDMFVRGQEIGTGGQRINDPIKLRESMRNSGIPESDMEEYLSAFDWGMPPHGGAGLGLERIITFFLDPPDVRLASLFHRDPHSLPVKAPSIPHPEADTTKLRTSEDGELPPAMRPILHGLTTDSKCGETAGPEPPLGMFRRMESKQQKGVFKVKEVDALDGKFQRRCHARIEEWKAARNTKGKQVYLTEIVPWRDTGHRRYFVAESAPSAHANADANKKSKPNGNPTSSSDQPKINTLVVLTRLSPSKGYQLKWALDFPQSAHEAIEAAVQAALSAVPDEPVTFGAAVSESFIAKHGIGGFRARFMERTYKGGVKATELGEIVKFFE
ncbi:hypothetical protein IAR55_003241 [Kwoniella newhampshirensis]|uniref:Probable aspartate--tRNA ligase, cytoplasmic n=1 Tax=Kwoniella newhampshirensis TaxID=1651941 RepID=A0AAW0YYZ8_9TREE